MRNAKISILEIKRYLKKKGLSIIKNRKYNPKNNNWGSLPRTILSSFIIICFFYSAPVFFEFKKERAQLSKDYQNNSKNNFQKVLDGKDYKLDEELNKEFVYEDVFEFEELPDNTVRLSASTIEQLFKETKYDLEDVRKNCCFLQN